MNPHPDPAYTERSIREEVDDLPTLEHAARYLAAAIDELRGIVEQLDERIRGMEQQPVPAQSWPLAIQSVFGVEVATPDEFVDWSRLQNLTWDS